MCCTTHPLAVDTLRKDTFGATCWNVAVHRVPSTVPHIPPVTMTRLSLGIVLATLVAVPIVGAQSSVAPRPRAAQRDSLPLPQLPILRSIAVAEEEGRLLPHGAAELVQEGAFKPGVVGSSARSCATVPRSAFADDPARAHAAGTFSSEIRTGDFTVGAGIGRLRPGQETKVYWIPLHHPPNGLLVRAALLGSDAQPGDTVRFTSMKPAYSASGLAYYFFPSAFMLPTAGNWLVVATSGLDWGCMIMPVG